VKARKSSKAVIAKNIPGNIWKLCKIPTVIRNVTHLARRPYAKLHSHYIQLVSVGLNPYPLVNLLLSVDPGLK